MIGLGHDVIAREIYVKEVGAQTAREQPDVAIVGLGLSSEHALDLIGEIVREASCPVIALLHANDPEYIREAAKRGVFAYIIDGTPEELQSAIDITLQRFNRVPQSSGRLRTARHDRAGQGNPHARHAIDAETAFVMLRDHSQHNGRKLADVAAAIVESHLLLLPPRHDGASRDGDAADAGPALARGLSRDGRPSASSSRCPRPPAEESARHDAEQPTENGAEEDDPDQRGARGADHPSRASPGACWRRRAQPGRPGRNRQERIKVVASPPCLAAEARAAGLDVGIGKSRLLGSWASVFGVRATSIKAVPSVMDISFLSLGSTRGPRVIPRARPGPCASSCTSDLPGAARLIRRLRAGASGRLRPAP